MDLIKKIEMYEQEISEVMGYKLKAKDQKVIKAFIDGATSGDSDSLWIEGDYLFAGMQSSTTDYVAMRKNGKIITGKAYGNVSQTRKNFIEKNK